MVQIEYLPAIFNHECPSALKAQPSGRRQRGRKGKRTCPKQSQCMGHEIQSPSHFLKSSKDPHLVQPQLQFIYFFIYLQVSWIPGDYLDKSLGNNFYKWFIISFFVYLAQYEFNAGGKNLVSFPDLENLNYAVFCWPRQQFKLR